MGWSTGRGIVAADLARLARMRRSLVLLGVVGLLSMRWTAAEAAPAGTEFRLKLRGDSLVTFDRAKLPPLPAGKEWALSAPGIVQGRRVKGDGDVGPLRFVVAGSAMRDRGDRTLTLAPVAVGSQADLAAVDVVDDDSSATEQLVLEGDTSFGPVAAEEVEVYAKRLPQWFLERVVPGGRCEMPLSLPAPGAEPDGTVRIQVEVARTHTQPVRLSATWGSKDLGTAEAAAVPEGARSPFVDTTSLRATFTLPSSEVPTAGGALTIVDRTDPLPPPTPTDATEDRGMLWIDRVLVEAPMKPHAGPRLVEPSRLRRRLAAVDGTPLLTKRKPAPDPVAAARGAEALIISTAVLLPGANRLAAHRTATGLRTAVVPYADVVEHHGGNAPPEALRDYLRRLAAAGTTPRFLLLCGDAAFDRVELSREETIPTAFVPTKYNGATASDRPMVLAADQRTGGPALGRLPFGAAPAMEAYVDRVIAAETKPPADASRRTLRFITSEGRFGPAIDGLIERLFRGIVATRIPPAYDAEITFASANSDFLWPPSDFNEKVIRGINDGALFHTYVGHGWWDGFDTLRYEGARYPILRDKDAERIDVRGTPPVMFVVACTTARFDDPRTVSIGERILAQPRGPLAYWGATRACHPAFNSMAGRQLAIEMFGDSKRRLGEIVRDAVDAVVAPKGADNERAAIRAGTMMMLPKGEDIDRLYVEGSLMYVLLGDPALRVPLPQGDLAIDVKPTPERLDATIRAPGLPDGTEISASLEIRRDLMLDLPAVPAGLGREAKEEAIRARHARANEKVVARAKVVAKGGAASVSFDVPEAWRGKKLCVKAWAVYGGDVHQGAWTPDTWIDPGTILPK
jgi:hypothetical protein